MGAEVLRSVDVVLTWSRTIDGLTAVLRERDGGLGWDELERVRGNEFTVRGLHPERAHRFAAAAVLDDGGLEPDDAWEIVRIVPLSDPSTPARPDTPTGLAIAQDGARLVARWDPDATGLAESYEIREGSTWEDGRLVAEGIGESPYAWAWWSSGATTFHLKAVDAFGRSCLAAASVDVTVAALGDQMTEDEVDEAAGSWAAGTAANLDDVGGALQLGAIPPFGALAAPFGSYAGVPCFARYWPTGTYDTAIADAGKVVRERVEVAWDASQPIDALPFGALRFSALGRRHRRDGSTIRAGTRSWSAKNSWRLTPLEPVDAGVDIDTSQTAAGAWDGWRPFVPGMYTYRRVRLRVTLRGDGLRYVTLPTFTWRRRRENLKDEGKVTLPGGGAEPVAFVQPFQAFPVVALTLQAGSAAVRLEVSSVTAAGCDVEAFDGSGNSVAAVVHWHALGT